MKTVDLRKLTYADAAIDLAQRYDNVYMEPGALGAERAAEVLPDFVRRIKAGEVVHKLIYGSDGPQIPGYVGKHLRNYVAAMVDAGWVRSSINKVVGPALLGVLVAIASGCGGDHEPRVERVQLSGSIAVPDGAEDVGTVYVSLYHAWALEGELRHPVDFIEAFETRVGAFSHEFDYPARYCERAISRALRRAGVVLPGAGVGTLGTAHGLAGPSSANPPLRSNRFLPTRP